MTMTYQKRNAVIGIGGLGGIVVTRLSSMETPETELICMDADVYELQIADCSRAVRLGRRGFYEQHTHFGAIVAEENREAITEALTGSQVAFLIAGMGGRTGGGAISVVAEIAKEMGIRTIGVVMMPFAFEGIKKVESAERRTEMLLDVVDCLIIVSGTDPDMTDGSKATLSNLVKWFAAMDIVLCRCVQSLVESLPEGPASAPKIDAEGVRRVLQDAGLSDFAAVRTKSK